MLIAMASQSQVPDDLISCPICLNDCEDPKTLPCHHGFCLKCLERYYAAKQPGQIGLCAVCRKDFRIPVGGVRVLPHHFYIQKLLDIKNINKHSDPDIPPCKVCMADSVDKVRERVARAKWFCQNCSELLCEDCCKAHKYMRTPHVLKVLTHELNQKLRQRVCGKHPEEFNDIYCWECDKNVCRSCVQEEHKRHSTLNMRSWGRNQK